MDFCFLFAGSVVGLKGNTGQCVYSASKAGLEGFTRSLAQEVASRNIRVNLLAPGTVQLSPQHLHQIIIFFPVSSVISFVFFIVFLIFPPSYSSRLYPHRHDRRAEGGGWGALHPTGKVWRARGRSPGRSFPFGVFLCNRTGAGGGWRAPAGHVGSGAFLWSHLDIHNNGSEASESLTLFEF